MSFSLVFDFLRELQLNNHKGWMDEHREYYETARDFFIQWLDAMNVTLALVDPTYTDTPGKKAINRINNNLMFHPNKPTYKDHFGAGLDQERKQGDFYIHLGVNEIFIGGGFWHPSSKHLKSIRQAIDYDGDALKKILRKDSFLKMFGGLVDDDPLKTAPKGYSQEHPHIELLRKKSFAVAVPLTRKEVMAENFDDKVIKVYKEMLPFRRYLNQAISV